MSGQGAYGVRGPTGPAGITGRKGRQGDGFGYTGSSLFAPGGTLTSSVLTGSSPYALTVTPGVSGTYYQLNISPTSAYGVIGNDDGILTTYSGGPFAVNDQLQGTNVYPGTYIVSITNSTSYFVYPSLSKMNGTPQTITSIPAVTLTLPTSGLVAGMFWVFNSITSVANTKFQINLVNGTAVYNGNAAATFIECAVGNSIILAYSGTAGSYIVF
jgi:hypothetical protein